MVSLSKDMLKNSVDVSASFRFNNFSIWLYQRQKTCYVDDFGISGRVPEPLKPILLIVRERRMLQIIRVTIPNHVRKNVISITLRMLNIGRL